MHFGVIGAGGVGGYFGGLLAAAGEKVTFVARGEHLQALREKGLTLKTVERSYENLRVDAVESIAEVANADVIFVATKTYDLEPVAKELAKVVSSTSIVIPLLNGIENDLRIKEHLKDTNVYPGFAYVISTRTAPGVVEQTAGLRTVVFGERGVAKNESLVEIADIMSKAGILAKASSEIEREMWVKFVWITTFAGMTALCRSAIGNIVKNEEGLALYSACFDEVLSVARAEGVDLADERSKILERVAKFRHTEPEAKSSLLVDIENRRRTEIDTLTGTIVRLAHEHKVPVPINEAIYVSVKVESDGYLNP